MNIYDKTHELARELKNTEEYREYARLKDIAMENETQKALIQEFKKLQFQLQVAMASGKQPDPDEMDRFQKIANVLQINPDVGQYLMAEMRFQKLMSDIFKILGEVADIDMDMLRG